MAYGTIKVDNITFTNAGSDQGTTVSGLYRAITSGVAVSGTISGATIQGVTVSGTTVTGSIANFVSGVFTTSISGVTVTGTTASFTNGVFTSLSGTTTTVTSGIFGAGSATAPSVAVGTGTTYNPGIYSPGTDQLAISTNGTGRLFVDSSGRLGVGTASPARTLSVYSTSSIPCDIESSQNDNALRLITLGGSGQVCGIQNSSGNLLFNASGSERARIDSSGRLGLGTSSPGYPLDVVSDSSAWGLNIRGRSADNAAYIRFSPNSGATTYAAIGTPSANTLGFEVNGSERARIDSSGRVGIGVTGPDAKLHVVSGATPSIAQLYIGQGGGSNNYYDANNHYFRDGNLNNVITATSSAVQFYISNAERARIDSSGRLLVGTSSARGVAALSNQNNRIQIADTGGISGGISTYYYSADGGSNTWNFCKSRGASEGSFTIVNNGDSLGTINWIGADGNGFSSVAASIASAVDATPGANDMPGRLVFSTTADGASSPTERLRVDSNGFTSYTGAIGRGAPVTKTGAFTVGIAENWLICNGTASITVTLPTASAWTGREIMLKTIAAFTVISASSNVVPLAGGAAGTAILAATAGKYATLVSDGTNWIIMQAN